MAAIDSIVAVNITQNTTAVAQASFAIPLIVGTTAPGWASTDYVHTYSAPSGMLTDGFTTSAPEYIQAQAMYAQQVTPVTFKVGKRSTAVAQVDTLKVATLTIGHAYFLSVNGVSVSYTASGADTQNVILGQLQTLIQAQAAVTGAITGSGTTATLTLTATTPGQSISYTSVDPFLTYASVTAANGIAQDLALITAQDNTWYGLATPLATDADILQAAAFVEGALKLYVPVSATAAIATAATTDVASKLMAAGYKRTGLVYSPANVTAGIGGAWLSWMLALVPGSVTWAFKSLAGQTADTLSASAQNILMGTPQAGTTGKNVNIYQTVGGVPITQMGTAASGQFFDITVGIDWLKSTIQTNVYQVLSGTAKVPMTDAGAGLLIAAVKQAIDLGTTNQLIDGNTQRTITAPPVASLSTTQRAARIGPPITFGCRLQGAQHAVTILGTVTV